jgi:predicted TIM-barrel fold metal-dependent hydrolase
MAAIRRLSSLAERYPIVRSVSLTPHTIYPFIAPNSREYYPVYAKCVELDLAAFVNVGFPGPRVPAWIQDPIHLDDVCWFFPDLRVVMRHGGEPWVDTCIKMLLRWPNLYYATTAFAPRYYPRNIIDFVNGRGRDKVLYAGYWPTLSYERIFRELAALPIKDDIWPGFLRDNAERAFKL